MKFFIKTVLPLIFITTIAPPRSFSRIDRWVDKDGCVHFSDSYVPEGEIHQHETLDSTTDYLDLSEKCRKIGIAFFNVKGDWERDYIDKISNKPKPGTFVYPRILYSIKNISEKSIDSLSFTILFLERSGNKIFGRGDGKLNNLFPGYESDTIFIKSNMGFIYNGYNLETILNKGLLIEIYVNYFGKDELVFRYEFYEPSPILVK